MSTIVAPATPAGRGALAAVRVSGDGARRAAREVLGLDAPEDRRATTRAARRNGAVVDQVVAVFWNAPETPTGEDLLEIFSHGSPEIVREIVASCVEAGARHAEPGEFTRRAFTNGRMDLAQAEGIEALISANGERARRAALERLNGGLSRRITDVRTKITDILALLEARLDHPDEDIPPLKAEDVDAAFAAILDPIQALLESHSRGKAARAGLRVALVGRPNAGKSSLLNALLGRDRAIVAPEPGTTRDTLEEQAELNGYATVLVDTAGLRDDATDHAEREGIARAERALQTCDVAVLVVDAAERHHESNDDAKRRALELASRNGRHVIVALNKADVASPENLSGGLAVSALTGKGLNDLTKAITSAASPRETTEDLLVNERDRELLALAATDASEAWNQAATHPKVWEDRAAAHLRAAHAGLGLILGEGAPDEILRAVFARFCVGK